MLLKLDYQGESVGARLGTLATDWEQLHPEQSVYVLKRTVDDNVCGSLNRRFGYIKEPLDPYKPFDEFWRRSSLTVVGIPGACVKVGENNFVVSLNEKSAEGFSATLRRVARGYDSAQASPPKPEVPGAAAANSYNGFSVTAEPSK